LIYRERIQMLCVPFFFLNKGKNCWRRGKRCSFLEDRCVSVEWYVFFFFVTAWNYKKLNIHMRVNRKIDKKQQCALFVWFDCFLERECKLFFWKRTDCDGQCAFIFCLFSFILQCVFFFFFSLAKNSFSLWENGFSMWDSVVGQSWKKRAYHLY
jgi:hypothetical protein